MEGLLERDVALFEGQRTAIHQWIASFAGGIVSKKQKTAVLGAIEKFIAAIAAARQRASAKRSYDEIADEYDALKAKEGSGSLNAHEKKRLRKVSSTMHTRFEEFTQADADFGSECLAVWDSIPENWRPSEHGAGTGVR